MHTIDITRKALDAILHLSVHARAVYKHEGSPLVMMPEELSLRFESTGRARTVVTETLKYLILFAILIVCTAFLAGNSFSPFLYYQF